VVILIVKDNIPLLVMVLVRVKRLPMLKHGKALNKVSQLQEFHVLPLKDIQLLLDGEMMLTLLLQVFSVSNHTV
jgi:hypothetical protein